MAHVCPPKAIHTFDNFLRLLIHKPQRLFGPYVRPGMTVMDIGCGGGFASIGLAQMVGEKGRVIAVDLQQEMLEMVSKRAKKTGLSERITLHLCEADRIGVTEPVDFAVAFWVVHEVPDVDGFLKEVFEILKPGGTIYIAEPPFHVSSKAFREMLATAQEIGFKELRKPFALLGKVVVLRKEG